MKFKFRLQSVYDLRQHLEDEQKDALAKERQRLKELEEEKAALTGSFEVWSKKYMTLAEEGMSPLEAVRIGQYLDDVNKGITLVSRRIERQNANVEKERLLLIEKMKDRKTMETLYDKQRQRFIYEESKSEEKEIEDMISSRR